MPHAVIAATYFEPESQKSSSKEQQRDDPSLVPLICYLKYGTLLEENKKARIILLNQSNYTILDDVLYYVEVKETLCIIPPKADGKKLWEELHFSCCGRHLKCAKSHGQLSKH